MTLPAGAKLGPYDILSPVGSGGMGDVYRARDTRLDRLVALKVLLRDVRHDPERRERFEREAKAVAALNHPNIVTIHSVEDGGPARQLTPFTQGNLAAFAWSPDGKELLVVREVVTSNLVLLKGIQ